MTQNKLVSMLFLAAVPAITSLLTTVPAYAGDESPFSVSGGDTATRPVPTTLEKFSTAKEYFVRACKEEQETKNWAVAEAYYTEALRLNPHYGEALGNRGAVRFNQGNYEGALSDYNQSLKIFPDNKALQDLKAKDLAAMQERANNNNQAAQNQAAQNLARANMMRTMMGGDFADPSTMIMMNAQRRGLINPQAVDYSDPASIIMMNAKRRGLVPADTPNP